MNLQYELYSRMLNAKASMQGVPLSGTFELTSRCNLNCKMCYIHKHANDATVRSREKSAGEWISLAEECCRAGMLQLLLTGGEPLLRPDFREIYSSCRNLGMLISVNTNGTLINSTMMDFFAKNPPARINITLYGASPETYGALCGDPDAYFRTTEAILGLKGQGTEVKLNFSETPYNKQDATEVYSFAREHGLQIQAATYMFPPVRACEMGCYQTVRMTPEESARERINFDRFRLSADELIRRWQSEMDGKRVSEPDSECQDLPTERIQCRAGSSTFWVTWDWSLRPCGMMTSPAVPLEAGHFTEAWNTIREERNRILFPAKCTACGLRHVCDLCPAVSYAETGSFTEAPDYMCRRTQAYWDMIQTEMKELQQKTEDSKLP